MTLSGRDSEQFDRLSGSVGKVELIPLLTLQYLHQWILPLKINTDWRPPLCDG